MLMGRIALPKRSGIATDIDIMARRCRPSSIVLPYFCANAASLLQSGQGAAHKLNYGTSSSLTKIYDAGFAKDFGVQAVEVPFAGGPWTTALGQRTVELGFISECVAVTLCDRLRALAVTGETRSPNYLNTPTLEELGPPN